MPSGAVGTPGQDEASSPRGLRRPARSRLANVRATVATGCCAAALLAGCGGAVTPGAVASTPQATGHAQGKATATAGAGSSKAAGKTGAAAAEERLLATIEGSAAHAALARGVILANTAGSRSAGAARAQVQPQAFRVRELPLVAVPAPLVASAAPASLPAGETPAELVVDWRGVAPERAGSTYTSVRVSLKGASYARLRIGGNETTIGNRTDGGLYVSCSTPQPAAGSPAPSPSSPSSPSLAEKLRGTPPRPPNRGGAITPARWEMLTLGKSVQLTIVDAWFDPATCQAAVVQRTTVEPRPLPGGVLYGYRASCPAQASADAADCGGRESMIILGPALTHLALSATTEGADASRGMFTRASFPLQRGGGASMVSRVDGGVLRDWMGEPAGAQPRSRQTLLGVEVVQGVGDREATAVSYVVPVVE